MTPELRLLLAEYQGSISMGISALIQLRREYGPDFRTITRGDPATPMNQKRAAYYQKVTQHIEKLSELLGSPERMDG